MSGDVIVTEGRVERAHASGFYTVSVALGGVEHRVLARRAGKLVKNWIKLLPGDWVTVEISPYDLRRGRVTRRHDVAGRAA